MTLVVGDGLDASRFFSSGSPKPRGSSFDLTIGWIFDHNGDAIVGPFNLKPGHMVQVVSAEVFKLPLNVTGHVTYKTALTREGIWELTVGIVDPGWDGPISTTLLNFSKVEYAIAPGEAFLRVSFFEHKEVSKTLAPQCVPVDDYTIGIRKSAMTKFSQTFLDKEEIAEVAGKAVLNRIRFESLGWVALIAVTFTVLQIILDVYVSKRTDDKDELKRLEQQIQRLEGVMHLA